MNQPAPGSNSAIVHALFSTLKGGGGLNPGWWVALVASVSAGLAAFDSSAVGYVRAVVFAFSAALVGLYVHECQATKRANLAASAQVTAARSMYQGPPQT